jgi:DegV family protein with EDD domain
MTVKIVTDSTSDISPQVAKELGITVVPLYVHFGEDVYRDGVDLSPAEFYQKLKASKILPTTSTISPGQFTELCDELSEQTDEILAITISSKMSATYDAALRGSELRKRKDCRVEVIDSRLVSMALGLVVIIAAQEAKAGANLEQIVDMVKKALPKIHIRMAFDTLEYLRKGGRIGGARAFLGTLLNVKPILTMKDGELAPVARERSRTKAIENLRRFATGFTNIREMVVVHADDPEAADALARNLGSVFPRERIYISAVGSVVGTHSGPGTLAIGVLEG